MLGTLVSSIFEIANQHALIASLPEPRVAADQSHAPLAIAAPRVSTNEPAERGE
jgi:hypothetical protein